MVLTGLRFVKGATSTSAPAGVLAVMIVEVLRRTNAMIEPSGRVRAIALPATT